MTRPDPQKVAAYTVPVQTRAHTVSDVLLYSLGLDLGSDPMDREELPFVYEEWGPKVLPTFATLVGSGMGWLYDPELGLGDARMSMVTRPSPSMNRCPCKGRSKALRGPRDSTTGVRAATES